MTGQSLQSHDGWTLCSISPSQHLFFPVHHVQTGEPMSQYNNGSIHIFMLSFSETTRRSAGTHIPLPYPRPPNIHLVGAPSAISSTTRRRALLTSYPPNKPHHISRGGVRMVQFGTYRATIEQQGIHFLGGFIPPYTPLPSTFRAITSMELYMSLDRGPAHSTPLKIRAINGDITWIQPFGFEERVKALTDCFSSSEQGGGNLKRLYLQLSVSVPLREVQEKTG